MEVDAPEEVMGEFIGGGSFEGFDLDALRVDASEYFSDGGVFPGGVHGLEDDEE